MNSEIVEGLQLMARDKGIDYETLVEALEAALLSAYKRLPSSEEFARVTFEDGVIQVYAQEIDEDGNLLREWDDTPQDFGRIAAQTAKQVLTQKIQAVERDQKYEEYQGREGDIVTGIVQQKDQRYTLLDLGKVEALMPQAEQVNYERYDQGARLKAFIVEVRKTAKGPQIVVSRTHPGLVMRLFELEVPEIADGIVEVKAIAREPGARTKIAVSSTDSNVDPVGACVGARGSRVRMIVNELRGEKVDIVPYADDLREFVAKALSPAEVKAVHVDEETKTATVVVPERQLSLAIGKEGQNAKLAARLTGWRVEIESDQPRPAPEPEPEAAAAPDAAGADDDGSAPAPTADAADAADAGDAGAEGAESAASAPGEAAAEADADTADVAAAVAEPAVAADSAADGDAG